MKVFKVDHNKHLDELTSNLRKVEKRDNIKGLLDEVLGDLDDGVASLFVGDKTGLVLRPYLDGDVLVLCVFFSQSTSGRGLSDHIDVFYKLARDINAKKVMLKTGRKGVVKLWERHGFKQTEIDCDGLFEVEKVLNYE